MTEDDSEKTVNSSKSSDELIREAHEGMARGGATLSEQMVEEALEEVGSGQMPEEMLQAMGIESEVTGRMAAIAAAQKELRTLPEIEGPEIPVARPPPTRSASRPRRAPGPAPADRGPTTLGDAAERTRTGPGRLARLIVVVVAVVVVLGILDNLDLGSLFDSDEGIQPGAETTTVPAVAEGPTQGLMLVAGDTVLQADHMGRIAIAADGITLDCAGHRVVGPAELVGIATAPDTTVRNCVISGFNTGVGLGGQSGVTVENVTVTDSRIGFYLVSGTSDAVILDSRAEGNEIGFLFENSVENARLEGNAAVANWRSGFMIGFTTNSTFIDNEAIDGGSGFWIANSRSNTFSGNHVSGASEWFSFGLFENTSDNVIENNEVTRGGVAFALGSGAADNTLRANTATNASKGFDLSGGARDNELIDNVATGTHDGFWVGDNAGSGNVITGNLAQGSENWGFVDLTTTGRGDFGTGNSYSDNVCLNNGNASTPAGLCQPG